MPPSICLRRSPSQQRGPGWGGGGGNGHLLCSVSILLPMCPPPAHHSQLNSSLSDPTGQGPRTITLSHSHTHTTTTHPARTQGSETMSLNYDGGEESRVLRADKDALDRRRRCCHAAWELLICFSRALDTGSAFNVQSRRKPTLTQCGPRRRYKGRLSSFRLQSSMFSWTAPTVFPASWYTQRPLAGFSH